MQDGYKKHRIPVRAVYEALFQRWGPQGWWPGRTRFEIITGAILVQNTSWRNVERAIAALRRAGMLDPMAQHALPLPELAELIRPAGCHTVKARRLRAFTAFLADRYQGRLALLLARPTEILRHELLALHGIGPETADSILLYAAKRPVFVVDAYLRRIGQRHGWIEGREAYDHVARCFTRELEPDHQVYNEYHALLVATGKSHCGRIARCAGCPLESFPRTPGHGRRNRKPCAG